LTANAEQIFPTAYGPLLNHFVQTLAKRVTSLELNATLQEVGRTVAQEFKPALPKKACATPIAGALAILKELGGAATVQEEGGKQFIRGSDCPSRRLPLTIRRPASSQSRSSASLWEFP
jgi:predicted ArsR family transcriptional regulator